MKERLALRPRAQADLGEIWDYTAQRSGLDQAETYTRQLWQDMATVADSPTLGRECNDIRAGYRKYPSGSHILFYRLTSGGIDVVRILHERMDPERYMP
jgi:toxin ParE1/3/4